MSNKRPVNIIVSGQEFRTTIAVLEKSSWVLHPRTLKTSIPEFSTDANEGTSSSQLVISLEKLGIDCDPQFFRVVLNFVRFQGVLCLDGECLTGVLETAKQLKMADLVRLIENKIEDEKKSAEDLRRRQLLNIFNFTDVNYNCRPVQAAEVDFSGLDLSFVQAPGEAFSGMNRSNFRRANFSNCRLYGANFRGADLSYACLRNADLRKADFRDAILVNADLYGCQVEHANFIGCNFEGAIIDKLVGAERSTLHAAIHSKMNEKTAASQKKWYSPWA
eukprot:jgi/Galph1/2780/GphlegSOOS_G1483.1